MNKTEFKAENILKNGIADGINRDYSAAVKKFKTVLAMTENLPEALLYLGRAYHELDKFDDAVISFRLYITREPKNDAGYFYLGRTYIAVKNYDRASTCFNEAVKLNSGFAPAFAYAGYSLMMSGDSSAAIEKLAAAVKLDPDNKRISIMYMNCLMIYSINEFRRERYNASLDGFLFLDKSGFTSVTVKLYIGIILKETGKYEEAAGYIIDALDYSPDDQIIKNILAELFIRLGRIDDSIELLSSYKSPAEIKDFLGNIDNIEKDFALSMWNKNDYGTALYFALSSLKQKRTADMHVLAGECYRNTGRFEEAYNHFTRASEIDRKNVNTHYGRVMSLWLQKDYKKIPDILKRIEKIAPEDDFADYYNILCSWMLNSPYPEWKDRLSARLSKEKDVWLYTARGWGELAVQDEAAAVKSFKNALKYENKLKMTWRGLFKALRITGSKSGLKTAFKKYLGIFNDDLVIRTEYSDILLNEGSFKQAANELRLILSKANPDMNVLKKYAYCLRKSGDYSQASIIYRQILSGDPYNENYLKLLLYCMRESGRDKETIAVIKSAIDAFKKPSLDLFLVYGATLYRNGFDEEALAVYQNCIYNGMTDWRLFNNIGILYENKGMKDWAEMYFKKAGKIKKK